MSTRYLSATDTAKHVRAALRTEFPGTRFSVRSDNGNALRISWTDGPPTKTVDPIVNRFKGSDWSGYTESTTPRAPIVIDDQPVRPLVEFVTTHRTLSDAYRARLEAKATEILGMPVDPNRRYPNNYPTEFGTWYDGTGHNLILWLAERIPATQP